MKKLLIPFVASFGLSLGIATGVAIVRTPKVPAIQSAVKSAEIPLSTNAAVVSKDTARVLPADSAGTTAITTPADSGLVAAAKGTHSDAATRPVEPAVATVKPAAGAKQTAPGASPNATVKVAAAPAVITKPVVPPQKPASDSLIGRRLAQVFGAMQAKDAARVLEQMDDTDVRAILGSLSSKQQAAILGSFPTQRAAVILQATLRTTSTGGAE